MSRGQESAVTIACIRKGEAFEFAEEVPAGPTTTA
jgi:hypothetical protein